VSNIPSSNQKIQIEATQYRAPVSESLAQTMGGSINYALDTVTTNSANIATIGAKTYIDATNTNVTFNMNFAAGGSINDDILGFDKTIDHVLAVSIKVWDWNGGGYTQSVIWDLGLSNADFFGGYISFFDSGTIAPVLGALNNFPISYQTIFLPKNTNSTNWELRFRLDRSLTPGATVPGITVQVVNLRMTQDTLLP